MLRSLGLSAMLQRVRLGPFSGLCVAGSLDVLLLRPCVLLWLLRVLSWLRGARLRPLLCLQRLVVVLLFPLLRVLRCNNECPETQHSMRGRALLDGGGRM